jgi:AraC family transcriptional regulator of adaptative response/methylated-DNA-[protein]-cysteine methyltransferase
MILIPCHRVISLSCNIGGYAGGIARKKWLIEHEKLNSGTYMPELSDTQTIYL